MGEERNTGRGGGGEGGLASAVMGMAELPCCGGKGGLSEYRAVIDCELSREVNPELIPLPVLYRGWEKARVREDDILQAQPWWPFGSGAVL